MAPLVSVLIPTVEGRERMLAECTASVEGQITADMDFEIEYKVLCDSDRSGCARTRNTLAGEARGRWLLLLDDDDLLLPFCVETLLSRADSERTIVYSRPLVWGEAPEQFWGSPPDIPATALISRALWNEIGGLDERLREREDRSLWEKAQKAGAKFVCVDDRPTWVYRLGHGGNKSRNNGHIP